MLGLTMDLHKAYRAQQHLLAKQLEIVRASIKHRGEKGAAVEDYVMSLLRDLLPAQYGLATGFIAFPPDKKKKAVTQSPQLDVIVYDALHGSPLVRLPTCDVLPLETAFAYVEVRTKVTAASIKECMRVAGKIRSHVTRWFWVNAGTTKGVWLGLPWCTSVRSYLFALEGPDPSAVVDAMREANNESTLAELSGCFIAGTGYFRSRPAEHGVVDQALGDTAFAHFRTALILDLARFDRYPGAVLMGPPLGSTGARLPLPYLDQNRKEQQLPPSQALHVTTAYLDHYANAFD